MKCPNCESRHRMSVLDSRPTDDGNVIRRRRCCSKCTYRCTTYEVIGNSIEPDYALKEKIERIRSMLQDTIALIDAPSSGPSFRPPPGWVSAK